MEARATEVEFSIKNSPSLTALGLSFPCTIDETIVTKVLNQMPHIQELHLGSNLYYFNLDSFVNLRALSLYSYIKKDFNFELFKNLCNQLENIRISIYNIDKNDFFKLFDGYNFPYLVELTIEFLYMKRLKKKFISRLPKHKQLNINKCGIEIIEHDSFSNIQHLTS